MKKIALIAAALLFAASFAAFAQAVLTGQAQWRALYSIREHVDPGISQSLQHGGTFIAGSYSGDNIKAFVKLNASVALEQAYATWTPGALSLTVAYGWTPISFWSDVSLNGDNNYQYGALGLNKTAHLKIGAYGLYAGIYQDGSIASVFGGDKLAPGFFVGYDYNISDSISVGIAGQGYYNDNAEKFSFAGALHGKLGFGAATVKFNVGYVKNEGGLGSVAATTGYRKIGEDYLEGFVGLNYKATDSLAVDLAAGLVYGLETYDDPAIKVSLDAPIKTGVGLVINPGVFFTYFGDKKLNADSAYLVQPGVTIGYAF